MQIRPACYAPVRFHEAAEELKMIETKTDIWSNWLLHRRYGGDPQRMKATLDYLYPVRDKVLNNAHLKEGEILLDVGCGDGLIAFGALEKSSSSKVIFSDISEDLLSHARDIAQEMNVLERCQFINASAEDLSVMDDETVDVVTTRSVLIYVAAKQQTFREFFRVLKPGGRLSIFEPINRFSYPPPEHVFSGYDVTPVKDLAQRVKEVYFRCQPSDTDPMLDFDEYNLVNYAERAGFGEVHLELQVEIKPHKMSGDFETRLKTAPNPKATTLEEAINEALAPDEAERFISFLRKLVEEKHGIIRSSVAYLWAIKS